MEYKTSWFKHQSTRVAFKTIENVQDRQAEMKSKHDQKKFKNGRTVLSLK